MAHSIPAPVSTAITPHVSIVDGQPTTTTRDIAEAFGKRHDDVLRIVRQRMTEAGEWGLRNFSETVATRENPSGGAPIKSPIIRMTESGFLLVVQKFTGKKAVSTQIAYVDEFERMRVALAQRAPTPANTAQALSAANAVAAQVQAAVFEQLMTGQGRMDHGRWIVSFANGRAGALLPSVAPVESGAVVMTLPYLAAALVEPGGMMPSNTDLANLAAACNKRLAQRLEYAESSARTTQKGVSHV